MQSLLPGHACKVCTCCVVKTAGQISHAELKVVLLELESEKPERICSPDDWYEPCSQHKVGHTSKLASQLLP